MKRTSYSSREILDHVQNLYDLGVKRPGTQAAVRAEEYLITTLEGYGYTVTTDEIPVITVEHRNARLVVGDDEYEVFPYIPSVTTGPEGVTAPLVFVSDPFDPNLDEAALSGKIIFAAIPYGSFSYRALLDIALDYRDTDGTLGDYVQDITWNTEAEVAFLTLAKRAGAAGVIGVYPAVGDAYRELDGEALAGMPEQELTPFLFNPLSDVTGRIPGPTPAAGLGPVAGARLEGSARRGETATLILDGETKPGVTRNIVAELPGEADDFVIVAAHHDTMWHGAVEECSGCGVVLALAEHYKKRTAPKPVGMRFVFFAGEQYRDLGVREYIEKREAALKKHLIADIHIEHVALEAAMTATGELSLTGLLQPRALFVTPGLGFEEKAIDVMHRYELDRTIVLPTTTPLGVPTDACPLDEAGFPILSFISAPLYWNATQDTMDKVPIDELSRVASAMTELVDRVMGGSKGEGGD